MFGASIGRPLGTRQVLAYWLKILVNNIAME
jgi:hypothetical protein